MTPRPSLPRRLWMQITGSARRRPRMSAVDYTLMQRDVALDELTRVVESYEEAARAMQAGDDDDDLPV